MLNNKKSSKLVQAPRKKQKSKDGRTGASGDSSAQTLNASLQARVVKRTEQRDEAHRKLARSRNTFDTLFEANPIPTVLTRVTDDIFINVNTAFLKYFGLEREEVIGHSAQELKVGMQIGSHDRIQLIKQLQREDGVRDYEYEMTLPSGQDVTVLISLKHLWLDDTEAVLSAFVDITERKKLEAMLRNMVDAAPDATVVTQADGTIALVNKQLENVFGHARSELIGKPLNLLIPERFHQLHEKHHTEYFETARLRQAGHTLKLAARRWDGSEFPVEITLSPLQTPQGLLTIASIRDVSKRLEAERRIRRLTSLLSEAEQKERERIAHILHDDLQQQLFAIRMQIPLMESANSRGEVDTVQSGLNQINEMLTEAIATTRNLSVQFNPVELQAEDLTDAFTILSAQMHEQHGLQVSVNTNDIRTHFDTRLSGLLFRAVRELLFNVVKHAGTLQAEVTLDRVGEEMLYITVSDEGRGFDTTMVLNASVPHGLLNTLRHLEMIGCQMMITSSPGAGTRVVIHCPNPG